MVDWLAKINAMLATFPGATRCPFCGSYVMPFGYYPVGLDDRVVRVDPPRCARSVEHYCALRTALGAPEPYLRIGGW